MDKINNMNKIKKKKRVIHNSKNHFRHHKNVILILNLKTLLAIKKSKIK